MLSTRLTKSVSSNLNLNLNQHLNLFKNTNTSFTRHLSSSSSNLGIPEVDIDNYRAEWKTYGDISNYTPGKFVIQTFNKISPIGLQEFDQNLYDVKPADGGAGHGHGAGVGNPHAILLRSHKLKEEEVPLTVRAIARYVNIEQVTCYMLHVQNVTY